MSANTKTIHPLSQRSFISTITTALNPIHAPLDFVMTKIANITRQATTAATRVSKLNSVQSKTRIASTMGINDNFVQTVQQ